MGRAVLVLVVTALALGTTACGGDRTSATSTAAKADPNMRCAQLWNAPTNAELRRQIQSMLAPDGGSQYVAVGYAATFPDRCLITVAVPDLVQAEQFIESRTGGQRYQLIATPDLSSLDAGDWNASLAANGHLAYADPGSN